MSKRIGVEIGGTKLQAALGESDGSIDAIERTTVPAGADAHQILTWFEGAVKRLLEGTSVSGIGIGFGGPVDTALGTVVRSHQVSGWDGLALRQWFADGFGVPAALLNDSNAAGWAEYRLGVGRGTRHFCYMNIGSGIGGALVIDGKLHDGQGLGAAEIGHTYVPDWSAAAAGRAVKLEDRCSGWAIERYLHHAADIPSESQLLTLCGNNRTSLTCVDISNAARQGDRTALDIVDRVADSLAVALSNVLALTHPECIAIGGGVGLMGDTLLVPLRRHLAAYAFEPYRNAYRVEQCELGQEIVLKGALLLAP